MFQLGWHGNMCRLGWHDSSSQCDEPDAFSIPHTKGRSSNQKPHQIPPPLTIHHQHRVLILDLEGVLLKSVRVQHGDDMPSWATHMRVVKDTHDVYHLVRPDIDTFLEFCYEYFELWMWSCYNLTKAQHIMELCFPKYYSKFKMIMSNKNCENSNIMIGYNRAYHKNLSVVWEMFENLHGDNTLIFDDTPYRIMWNMTGTYLIFPKIWRQSPAQLESFLEETIIPWLLGWLYAKDKRDYTRNMVVNIIDDPETKYVLDVYLARRKTLG